MEVCVFADVEMVKSGVEGYMFDVLANVWVAQGCRFRWVVATSVTRRHRDIPSWAQGQMPRVRILGAVIHL